MIGIGNRFLIPVTCGAGMWSVYILDVSSTGVLMGVFRMIIMCLRVLCVGGMRRDGSGW